MQSDEIRKRFLAFFEKRGHTVIPSASLVPENDPSVLFTTAGMQPLVPYLLGQPHPAGKRLVNVQKCVRTQDIDEVGDKTHDTFFEMLGNWSLGDYFKKEAITWSYEFLTSKEEGLGLDPKRLYITCFEGDADALSGSPVASPVGLCPRDEESATIWKSLGIPENRIYFLGKDSNWWSPGPSGPCGPDTEMFYDITGNLNLSSKEEFLKADKEQKVVEIWNDVFMEYEKKDGKVIGKLSQKNVDTGAGLERLAMVTQGKDTIFETDLFSYLIKKAKKFSRDSKKQRIIVDHLRTTAFMITDGVKPSNTDRGYILRRLLRRAIFNTDQKVFSKEDIQEVITSVVEKYGIIYKNLRDQKNETIEIILEEQKKFSQTLKPATHELLDYLQDLYNSRKSVFEKNPFDRCVTAERFFYFNTSRGIPNDLIWAMIEDCGLSQFQEEGFEEKLRLLFDKHKDISRAGAEKKFKGGLADESPETIRLHTATHLLHAALRKVLGDHVYQKGSNITPERLRFDFSHPAKMTTDEINRVEKIVNDSITMSYEMRREVLTVDEAKNRGAIGLFDDKYAKIGGKVSVYSTVDPTSGKVYSSEICGGPHVGYTHELGHFRVLKEEAVAAGIRRIKATLSPLPS